MKIKNDKLIIQITCLVVSIVLWMVIMYITPEVDTTYSNIPVTIRNLSSLENANLIMMNQDKENITVNVKVTGLYEQVNKISKSDFSAYIDVLGYGEGVRNADVKVVGPSGVEVKSVYPSQIVCNIEAITSKVMDVTVQFEGEQAKDHYRDVPRSNPSSVKITGPRSIVNSASMAVATVNIANAADTIVKTGPVRIYDDKKTEILMSAPVGNVEVYVPIYPTKYLELKPAVTGVPEEGYELVNVTVVPEKIRVAAKQDILDTFYELNLEELDLTGAHNNTMSSKNILNADGLILLGMETKPVVNATVEKVIERVITYKLDDIKFVNNLKDKKIIFDDTNEEISITVEGTSTLVNSLKKEDIILTVDLAEAVTGNNTLAIQYETEYQLKNIALSTEHIKIQLTDVETSEE